MNTHTHTHCQVPEKLNIRIRSNKELLAGPDLWRIVQAYYQEWGQVFALSEPLDWESEWVEPEYRIGT